jgi:hypothetical protein
MEEEGGQHTTQKQDSDTIVENRDTKWGHSVQADGKM